MFEILDQTVWLYLIQNQSNYSKFLNTYLSDVHKEGTVSQ